MLVFHVAACVRMLTQTPAKAWEQVLVKKFGQDYVCRAHVARDDCPCGTLGVSVFALPLLHCRVHRCMMISELRVQMTCKLSWMSDAACDSDARAAGEEDAGEKLQPAEDGGKQDKSKDAHKDKGEGTKTKRDDSVAIQHSEEDLTPDSQESWRALPETTEGRAEKGGGNHSGAQGKRAFEMMHSLSACRGCAQTQGCTRAKLSFDYSLSSSARPSPTRGLREDDKVSSSGTPRDVGACIPIPGISLLPPPPSADISLSASLVRAYKVHVCARASVYACLYLGISACLQRPVFGISCAHACRGVTESCDEYMWVQKARELAEEETKRERDEALEGGCLLAQLDVSLACPKSSPCEYTEGNLEAGERDTDAGALGSTARDRLKVDMGQAKNDKEAEKGCSLQVFNKAQELSQSRRAVLWDLENKDWPNVRESEQESVLDDEETSRQGRCRSGNAERVKCPWSPELLPVKDVDLLDFMQDCRQMFALDVETHDEGEHVISYPIINAGVESDPARRNVSTQSAIKLQQEENPIRRKRHRDGSVATVLNVAPKPAPVEHRGLYACDYKCGFTGSLVACSSSTPLPAV